MPLDDLITIAIEEGADDYEDAGEECIIYTDLADLHEVAGKLKKRGVDIVAIEPYMRPTTPTRVSDEDLTRVEKLVTRLEDLDDVMTVYTNVMT